MQTRLAFVAYDRECEGGKNVAWRERPVDLDSLSFIRIERCGLPLSIDIRSNLIAILPAPEFTALHAANDGTRYRSAHFSRLWPICSREDTIGHPGYEKDLIVVRVQFPSDLGETEWMSAFGP